MDLNRRALGGGLLASLALSVKRAFGAQAPSGQVISFQGRLTDAGGVALPDGTHSMTLVLYDNGIPTGFTETQSVVVKDGVFSAWLGEQATLPRFDPTHDYGVGVSVDGGGELLPRQRLGAVPIAQTATYGSVPIGGIIHYWGSIASLPLGYELCDGGMVSTSGSPLAGQTKPNLVNKFVRGATGDVKTTAVTGGADSASHSHAVDAHTHGINADAPGTNSIANHAHSIGADGSHSHSGNTNWGANSQFSDTGDNRNSGSKLTVDSAVSEQVAEHHHAIESDGNHSHGGATGSTGSHDHTVNSHTHGGATAAASPATDSKTIPTVPAYVGLLYIIRVL